LWKGEISAVSSLCVQPIRQQKRPDSSVRRRTTRQPQPEQDATPMALSPASYRKRWAEPSGSSHSIWTSASVRIGSSSYGSRRVLAQSSARPAPYRPLPGSVMTPAARPISRVGAVLSFVYPAYLNSKVQSQFTVQPASLIRWITRFLGPV
jgi:hypothetical protein